jgi:nucleoside phosphorylase
VDHQGVRFRSVVVLTALGLEREAVLKHLEGLGERMHPTGTIYSTGTLATTAGPVQVAVGEIGAGNPAAAAHVERAVAMFEPQLLMFIGVAGGLKDVRLGDVVVASRVYGYEGGKAEADGFKPRPASYPLPHRIDQRVRHMRLSAGWTDRIAGGAPASPPTVHLAPIAAGEAVLASKRAPLFEFLRTHYNDAVAVEMEGLGFSEGAFLNPAVSAVVVRGTSDLLDGKSAAGDGIWQPIAARHAAAFGIELIDQLQDVRPPQEEGSTAALEYVATRLSTALYINVAALLSDPSALRLLTEETLERLRGIRGWPELGMGEALHLRQLCEAALRQWSAPAVPLAESLESSLIGARVTFDGYFRTKNWQRYDADRGLTGDLELDPHIYTDAGGHRVFMPLDPRWAPTSTSAATFSSGSLSLSGMGVLRAVDEPRALVSPTVITLPTAGHEARVALYGE